MENGAWPIAKLPPVRERRRPKQVASPLLAAMVKVLVGLAIGVTLAFSEADPKRMAEAASILFGSCSNSLEAPQPAALKL